MKGMSMSKYRFVIFLMFFTLFANILSAGTTGKLIGRVIDKESGDPIIGATIMILDKQMGTITDARGRYMVINIPAGKYDVKAFRMDYAHMIVEKVKINLDLTTTLNFELQKKAIGIEGITVKAKRKLVERDITGSENIVAAEDMEHMTVENIQDIVAVTAGAVGSGEDMHIRGGRSGEVVYTIDGMSVSNPVDGGFGMNLDMDAVSDMSIQTGGFTAEFGNAQSAIINLITKSGGPEYTGKIESSSDHLFNDGNNSDQIKFALGGPIIPFGSKQKRDKYTFYINASGSWTDTRYGKYYTIDENDILWDLFMENGSNVYADSLYFINEINSVKGDRDLLFDFFDLGNRFKNNYQMNTKVKFQFTPKHKLTFSLRGDSETYLPYSHSMKYSLQYYNHWTTTHDQQAFTWDHTLSSNMFYTIRGSRFATDINLNSGVDRDWYFSDENFNLNPDDPESNNYGVDIPGSYVEYKDQLGDVRTVPYFSSIGSHSGSFIDDKTVTYTLRGDLTYQVNNVHSFKTGIEIKYNEIFKDRLVGPWIIDDAVRLPNYLANCPKDGELVNETDTLGYGGHTYLISDFEDAVQFAGGSVDGYKAYPWQGAYYLQDKMEWEGMIVNAGMRFDFWYLGEKYQTINDTTGNFVDAKWDYVEYLKQAGSGDYYISKEKVEKFQLMISPRLGVSHPITEKDVMHFAYNYQSQLPPMRYVFTSARPEVGSTGTSVGNPNLKPETTITYEVGVEHQMAEDYLLDVTIFYKNIHNLVSTWSNDYSLLPDSIAESGKQHYLYITNDYGSARGIEFTLRKRFSNFWGFNLGYTYSWATGRNSEVSSATDNLREFPLDWDVRHIGSVNFDFRIPEDEEFYVLGLKMPDKFYANFLWQIQSGEPYTPITPDPESNAPLETNSARKPWTNVANVRFSKVFNLFGDSKIKFYLNITNLFDTENINWVNEKTGETDDQGTFDYWDDYDLDENDNIDTAEDIAGAAIYMAGLSNPGIYTERRKYNFGIAFEF